MDPLTSGRQGSDHHLYLHSSPAKQSEPEACELCAQCGKLTLLDRLLTRLHRDGHKVLIFSQVRSWGLSHVISDLTPVVSVRRPILRKANTTFHCIARMLHRRLISPLRKERRLPSQQWSYLWWIMYDAYPDRTETALA